MKARIYFRACVEIEGKDLAEIKAKFEDMNLFSKDAERCGADFVEMSGAQDADTCKDLMDSFIEAEA